MTARQRGCLGFLASLGVLSCSANVKPEELMVPMRDGVQLHTLVWRPCGEGPWPVVLTRGYWPGNDGDAQRFVRAGYVYVGQSTRGHARSQGDGVGRRFFDDGKDGADTLTWLGQQTWCAGKVAMYGKSYWAATQWLAALEGHPLLCAIVPQNYNTDIWQWGYWCNGALSLAMTANGRAYDRSDHDRITASGWDRFFRHLPLQTLQETGGATRDATRAGSIQLWQDYVAHSSFDDYWRAISLRGDGADGKHDKVKVPVYLMAGWYDAYPGAAFRSFDLLRRAGAQRGAGRDVRIVVNPADHLNRVVEGRDFGKRAAKDEVGLAIRWLDHHLRGVDNGVDREPPVRYFLMGANEWHSASEWPPAKSQPTRFYLHANANSRHGTLDRAEPPNEPPTHFVYDPNDPVPTLGGNHSFCERNLEHLLSAGVIDQRPNEARSDMLVFSSAPLREELDVVGPVRVVLYFSSDAKDTDLVARLIDVQPDGRALNLTEGILRLRYRESIWADAKLLEPGKVYRIEFDLHPTANRFGKGHCIRLHVTSSCFPLWDRNLNTGARIGYSTEMRKATQTVFHDGERPSHVELHVLSR